MCAVSAGREKNVALLLGANADVNMENENEETVLHMTKGGSTLTKWHVDRSDILILFIDRVADINKKVGYRYVRDIKDCYGLTVLMKCASRGCTESIQLLLDRGADMSIQDENGNTAAHYAAFDNQREAYVMLLHNGYDESTVNKESKTALDYVHSVVS